MFVRLAMPEDVDEVVEMGRDNWETSFPEIPFDEPRCRETFQEYLDTASPTIWVVEHKRMPIAFLLADMYGYRAAAGFFASQEILYVKREHRGSRASVLLMKHFIEWSEGLGAREIVGGVDNAQNIDHFLI